MLSESLPVLTAVAILTMAFWSEERSWNTSSGYSTRGNLVTLVKLGLRGRDSTLLSFDPMGPGIFYSQWIFHQHQDFDIFHMIMFGSDRSPRRGDLVRAFVLP